MILVAGGKLLTILRDNNPHIPYPLHWSLPDGRVPDWQEPEDAVYEHLLRKFGWREDDVQLYFLGASSAGNAFYFGNIDKLDWPTLCPGEGIALGMFSEKVLAEMLDTFGIGKQPGQFVPMFASRRHEITGLMNYTIMPAADVIKD